MKILEGIAIMVFILAEARILLWVLSISHKRYDSDTVETLETEFKRVKEAHKERERRRN